MGTRSTISIQNADGTVTSTYCHWDGCISHHGPILLNHYNTEAKVRELLALGGLSVLGEVIGKKHDFDQRYEGSGPRPCTSYLRDRSNPEILSTTGLIEDVDTQEFNYLFSNGRWEVSEGDLSNLRLLAPEAVAAALTK